jgi:hypothetical protein
MNLMWCAFPLHELGACIQRASYYPSGGLIRIGNDLIADTTAIAQEDRMAEFGMPLVRLDESKAHRL